MTSPSPICLENNDIAAAASRNFSVSPLQHLALAFVKDIMPEENEVGLLFSRNTRAGMSPNREDNLTKSNSRRRRNPNKRQSNKKLQIIIESLRNVQNRSTGAGVLETAIVATSDHRQGQSLASYTSRNSLEKRSAMSAILDNPLASANRRLISAPVDPPKEGIDSMTVASSAEFDCAGVDDYIATCNMEKVCSEKSTSAFLRPQPQLQAMKALNFSGAQFGNNCTIHLNV